MLPLTRLNPRNQSESASALVVVMVLLVAMVVVLEAVQSYTSSTHFSTARQGSFLRVDSAAEAGVEAVTGRLTHWVQANGGFTPSIGDCNTVGIPGNATFPAVSGSITPPAGSKLADYTFSIPKVYPVMPDDTVVLDTTDKRYLPDLADRLNVSENSPTSVLRYYFTWNGSNNAKNVPTRTVSYQITVTATPKVTTRTSGKPYTLVRYVRFDKVSPFNWCTYRMGASNYTNSNTYVGPLYVAGNVSISGPKFTDSFLYGGSLSYSNATWLGAGKDVQLKPTPLLSLIPNLAANLAVDSNGVRQQSFEDNKTPTSVGSAAPADMFSTRELIEPPTNPSNDATPGVIREARIYNQADVRIKVSVTTNGTTRVLSKSVVNIDGTTVDASANPWVTPLLNAVTTKTNLTMNSNNTPQDSNAFIDRSRSSNTVVQITDINVGALKTVMEANPAVFPTGIIYAWDDTGLNGGTRPLTGVRLWNAGVLPSGGLVVGTNDPVYLKGDFNTGSTLPSGGTIDSQPAAQPRANTMGNSGTTTATDRVVSGYTLQPAGVFGDSVTELSNSWLDANSLNTGAAKSTTINLVEGWSSMTANDLKSDDTYVSANRANPLWIESWGGSRRTMSGEEFVGWHSRYGQNTANYGGGGGWVGDITYDSRASALKLNWGNVTMVRERAYRK